MIFITSNTGLDFKNSSTIASLWSLDNDCNTLVNEAKGNLKDINKIAKKFDEKIAIKILQGKIHGLICISSDPNKTNERTILAAIKMGIPLVGTGGTSISTISLNGANVIGSSGGSVATTSISRGISFASSLASFWKLKYIPYDNMKLVKIQAVTGASIPILLISSLSKFFIKILLKMNSMKPFEIYLKHVRNGLKRIVPTVITMISCQESSQLHELSMITGGAVGSMQSDGIIIISIISGVISGWLLTFFLTLCSKYHFLPTSTTIISIGLSVIISGLVSLVSNEFVKDYRYLLQPSKLLIYCNSLILLSNYFKSYQILLIRGIIGGLLGFLSSIGSEYGYYHTVMLPLIAMDMELGDFSIFGAFDLMTLCIPSGAICCAIYLLSFLNRIKLTDEKDKILIHSRLGFKGFISNIFFGDFVESCYPYSLEYPVIITAIRISCILSGSLLGIGLISSSAYLPLPISLYIIPNNEVELHIFNISTLNSLTIAIIASAISFLGPFIVTIIYFYRNNKQKKL